MLRVSGLAQLPFLPRYGGGDIPPYAQTRFSSFIPLRGPLGCSCLLAAVNDDTTNVACRCLLEPLL